MLRLRAVARDPSTSPQAAIDAGDQSEEVARAVREARAAYMELGPRPPAGAVADAEARHRADAASALAIFRRVWTALGALPPRHPLHIPPIYKDDAMLESLLLALIGAVRVRERGEDE